MVADQAMVAVDTGAVIKSRREARDLVHVTSLGARPVAALTDLLQDNST